MTSRWARTAVTALAIVGLGTMAGAASPQRNASAADVRQRVTLPRSERDQILAEMRGMLESVRGILFGLASKDMPAIEKAARTSAVRETANPELDKTLPEGFLRFRLQTHQGFQALADQAHTGGTEAELIRKLATLTNNCVGCHGAFRVVEGPAARVAPRQP